MEDSGVGESERWIFLRDVVVFQLKMVVSNLRDWALIPVSLGAAVGDLITRGEREGTLFYSVLRWAAKSERMIDVYSSLERREGEAHALSTHVNPSYAARRRGGARM